MENNNKFYEYTSGIGDNGLQTSHSNHMSSTVISSHKE
jgi:hypothetical protein